MAFAYRHPQHRAAIARTASERWYAEELFARFEVRDVVGDRSVLGWGRRRGRGRARTGGGTGSMRLVRWTPDDLARRLDDVVAVYGEAMGYRIDLLEARRGYIATHVRRPGFRAVATLDHEGHLARLRVRLPRRRRPVVARPGAPGAGRGRPASAG